MAQNTSAAVMAQRAAPRDGLDDFPTHPWALRAFIEYIFVKALRHQPDEMTVWEPAANRRFMSRTLAEYFEHVWETDIHDYGVGVGFFDFLTLGDTLGLYDAPPFANGGAQWIISNPPFKDFEKWVELALECATDGIALFGRLQMLETIARYINIWKRWQDHTLCAAYIERVSLVEGGLDPSANLPQAYAWLVIDKTQILPNPYPGLVTVPTVLIPPCRDQFVRPGDYEVRAAQ
ncbi:hypothetical protein [Magnetovibrio sp.]|uniref:hypothetical protein n=1 Tax=Magnetovibrio sp. TaxID=2024836 RepID=UPI002F9238CD